MTERRFTLAEANDLLPQFRALLQELAEVRRRALVAGRDLKRAVTRAGENGGSEGASRALVALDAFANRVARTRRIMESHGAVLKDASRGLVDFPARSGGREIYLCWQLGEEEILWWHDPEAGFAGRRPVSDLEE